MENAYSIDIVERHKKWLEADEGKIFWRWLQKEHDEALAGSRRFLGAHDTKDIIRANKMIATQDTLGHVTRYAERLTEILEFEKSSGNELTDLGEL